MARKLRVEFEGAINHVTVRGVERRPIFRDDVDRERFVVQLADSVEFFGVRLYLYVLMANHVHLLVETPRGNLSAFMQRLQTAYSVYFNRRHRRAGHLTQGRYGAQLVQGDTYLLNLSRYIHLNPVFVGARAKEPLRRRIQALRAHRWSSYRGYVGLARPEPFVDRGPVLASVPGGSGGRARDYRRFVESGIARTDEEFLETLRDSTWGIGDSEFRRRVRREYERVAVVARRVEDVAYRRTGGRRSPDAVLASVAKTCGVKVQELRERRYGSPARAVAMYALGKYAAMNQREVAALLRVGTGSAVCRAVGRLAVRQGRDQKLKAMVVSLESALAR